MIVILSLSLFLSIEEFLLTNIIAGMLSGAISSAIANPTDVLKVSWFILHQPNPVVWFDESTLFMIQVRMQSGTSGTVLIRQQSCLKSFWQIYSEEGLRGLYRVSRTLTLLVSRGFTKLTNPCGCFPKILLTSTIATAELKSSL